MSDMIDIDECVEEDFECEDSIEDFGVMNNFTSNFPQNNNQLEIKFKVKKDFEQLFKAIQRTYEKTSSTLFDNVLSVNDLIECIDLESKTINKWAIYSLIKAKAPKPCRKEIKERVKKELASFITGDKYEPFEYNLCIGMGSHIIEYTEIIETNGETYCRLHVNQDQLKGEFTIQTVEEKLGNFAEKVVEAVKIENGFMERYTLLKFEVENGCLKVHDILVDGGDVNIRLIDKTKVYVVKADVTIPETMVNVIRQVDKIDKIIESVEEADERRKFQYAFEKLVYRYSLTDTYLMDHYYNEKMYMQRDYEKERLFESLDKNIREILMRDNYNDNCINIAGMNETVLGLTSKIAKVEENKFSDDCRHWTFKGTFRDIDRVRLESAFKALKDNVQAHGMAEQYVDIRVAEVG